MAECNRRRFLRNSATVAALPAFSWSIAAGSNDALRVAVVGLQRKGPQHVDVFHGLPGVRVTALCDADTLYMDRQARKLRNRGEKPACHQDFRKLLEDKDIDAVVIATPNHWHSLMTVWACQAGKDVYVEKPVSHNIWEGRKMVEAARKHKRIVQTGTQNRSDIGLKQAVAWIREGNLGKILLARGFDYPRRRPIGKVDGPQPIPKTVDYNLFQGPAPLEPLMRKNLHYDWHFVWPTGNGDCGNRGVHTLDHIRFMLGEPALPSRVISFGGRFAFDDDATTPNTQVTWFDTKPVPIIWELRTLTRKKGDQAMDSFRGMRASMIIECENGHFAGGRGGGWAYDKDGKKIKHFKGDGGRTHQANFIKAVRSRKPEDLEAGIPGGHLSSAMCHLANISWLVGRRSPNEKIKKAASANEVLAESTGRMLAHLEANEVKEAVTLGAMLEFDPESEKFTGENRIAANKHLSRLYRKPFVVPEEI
jgi:predicted dehydrogenase